MGKPIKQGFDFDVQLEVGKRGEAFLLAQHPELRPAPEGERRWDLLRHTPVPAPVDEVVSYVEVKTDTYDPECTPNFFMERWVVRLGSGKARAAAPRQDGGPWRARRDGVDEFCYLFINAKPAPVAFWFRDLEGLCWAVEQLAESKRAAWRAVYNQGVRAEGLVVPRGELAAFYEERRYEDG